MVKRREERERGGFRFTTTRYLSPESPLDELVSAHDAAVTDITTRCRGSTFRELAQKVGSVAEDEAESDAPWLTLGLWLQIILVSWSVGA